MSVSSLILSALLFLVLKTQAAVSTPLPRAQFPADVFWEKKSVYRERIHSERAIFVTVTSKKLKKPINKLPKQLQILGIGLVNAPPGKSFRLLKDFSVWENIHASIKVAKWTPETRRLFLHMEAFNYHAKMILRVDEEVRSLNGKTVRKLFFEVKQGSFQGLRAALHFKDAKGRKSEISMTAQHEFDKLSIPRFFIEFGLEVVFQQIAQKMRSFVESELKTGRRSGKVKANKN